MTARLSSLRHQPITERDRRAALAIVLVLLIGAALVLAITRPAALRHHSARSARVAVTAVSPQHGQPSGSDTSSGGTPTEEAVMQAGRVFLIGYLAYLYGRGTAGQIRDATPALVRSLQADPPRVSPAMREHAPQIVGLRSTSTPAGQLALQAVVNDGGLVDYPIGLLLEDHDGRLLVTGLDGEG